jgi:hypothetical protein
MAFTCMRRSMRRRVQTGLGFLGQLLDALQGRRVEPVQGRVDGLQTHRHERHGQHQVDHAGGDRVARHAIVLGFVRYLGQGHAALFLDPRDAHRTVGASTGQHHADGEALVSDRQLSKEQVDGDLGATEAAIGRQGNMTIAQPQVIAGGDHVHMVRFEFLPLLHLHRGHGRVLANDLRQAAVLVRVEMQHNDEGHAAVGGHASEEFQQGLQAPRRRADPHHGESPGHRRRGIHRRSTR